MIRTAFAAAAILVASTLSLSATVAADKISVGGHDIVGEFCIGEYQAYRGADAPKAFAVSGDGQSCWWYYGGEDTASLALSDCRDKAEGCVVVAKEN